MPSVAPALLEHGVAVDARDASFGQTALMVAARARASRARASCCSTPAPTSTPRRRPRSRRASFRRASRRRACREASASCAPAGPKAAASVFRRAARKTPLLYAAREGHLDVARLLVERGANLELADGNGVTPLIDAIVNASIFRVNRSGRERPSDASRTCCSTPARTSTRWIGTARRRSGPPSTCAISSSAPPTSDRGIRDEAFALIERLLAAGRRTERAHARVSARAPLHRRRSSAPWRGSTSRARRRSCAPRPPAICA